MPKSNRRGTRVDGVVVAVVVVVVVVVAVCS